jgi:hypothetical protein
MTIQQIYDKFATLQTSSDKLFFIDELRFLTNNKIIKFDLNFDSIEESIMNEQKYEKQTSLCSYIFHYNIFYCNGSYVSLWGILNK